MRCFTTFTTRPSNTSPSLKRPPGRIAGARCAGSVVPGTRFSSWNRITTNTWHGFLLILALVVSGNLESGNLEMLIYNQVSCFFCFWKNNLYVGGTTLYPGVRSEARQFLFTNIQRWGASNNVHGKLGFNAHALLVSVSSCQALAQSLGRYSKLYNPGQRWHIARPQKMISIWYLQTSPGWRSSDGTCMKILRKSCPQLPCVYHSAWD